MFKRRKRVEEVDHALAETFCALAKMGLAEVKWDRSQKDFTFVLSEEGKTFLEEDARLKELGVVFAVDGS